MKRQFIFGTFVSLFLLLFSSCSSTQVFTVHGIPGTVISKPDGQQISTIDMTGQTQITTSRKEGYYCYLLAQAPQSRLAVPFALDYKNHNRNAAKNLLLDTGYPILSAGAGAAALGVFCMGVSRAVEKGDNASETFNTFGKVALAGLGAAAVGGLITVAGNNMEQLERNYDYLKEQRTNNDLIR